VPASEPFTGSFSGPQPIGKEYAKVNWSAYPYLATKVSGIQTSLKVSIDKELAEIGQILKL
jgi:hypothetical protein